MGTDGSLYFFVSLNPLVLLLWVPSRYSQFQFFKVELFGDNGQLISEQQVLQQLHDIIEQSVSPATPIGILTTDHRDNWGQAYQHLIQGILI